MSRKVYVQDGYVLQEAHEPYYSFWTVMDAPEGVDISQLTVVDGVVVEHPSVEIPIETPVGEVPPPSKLDDNVMEQVITILMSGTATDMDFNLVALSALTLVLAVWGKRPELTDEAIVRIRSYIDARA